MERDAFLPDEGNRMSASLAGVALVLFIVVVSLVIVRKLQVRCMMEACALSQQVGCEEAIDRLRVSKAVERLWGK